MPSSISSSDPALRVEAPQPGLRLTASDRPGVAQPVPERDIPDQPWRAIALAVLLMTATLTGLWEWHARTLELRPGDFHDDNSQWAELRRRVDTQAVPVALVGDSRILFDTDLDHFQKLTGVRPLQLALPGTNGRPFLEDLADDPHFKGLVIVGMADPSYFRDKAGLNGDNLKRGHWESPGDQGSYLVRHELQRRLAFLAPEYRLSSLVTQLDRGVRPKVEGPYEDVWKISETFEDRQTFMWPRIEHDAFLREHARHAWDGFRGPVATPQVIAMTQAKTKAAVDKIRARGGDVVFLRPPSAPELRVNEEKRIPKAKGWDALLKAANAQGVHIDDLPQAQGLTLPEFSHLNRACARVFTDAYVRALATKTAHLQIRADAAPPLSTADCVPARVATR